MSQWTRFLITRPEKPKKIAYSRWPSCSCNTCMNYISRWSANKRPVSRSRDQSSPTRRQHPSSVRAKKRPIHLSGNNQAPAFLGIVSVTREALQLSGAVTRDNTFQTDIKCVTLLLPTLPHNKGRVGAIKTQWGQFPPDPPPRLRKIILNRNRTRRNSIGTNTFWFWFASLFISYKIQGKLYHSLHKRKGKRKQKDEASLGPLPASSQITDEQYNFSFLMMPK